MLKKLTVRRFAVILAAVAALVGIAMIATSGGSNTATVEPPSYSAASLKREACMRSVHYYAYDAPAGSNQFGPAIEDESVQHVWNRFVKKTCRDPLFAAVQVETLRKGGLDSTSPARIELRARHYVQDRSTWRKDVKSLLDWVENVKVVNESRNYETLLMKPSGGMPQLGRTARGVPVGTALLVRVKDGSEHLLRLVCDLQPAEKNLLGFRRFHQRIVHHRSGHHRQARIKTGKGHHGRPRPHRPGLSHRPPPHITPRPPHSPPPSGGGRKPKQSKDCMLNGGPGCPPNRVVQGGGQDNGSTPGAGAEPKPHPKGPTPQEGTPAPIPDKKGGGYDSGSGSGSGTPGGSTTDKGGTEGGGPSPGSGPTTDVDNSGNDNPGPAAEPQG